MAGDANTLVHIALFYRGDRQYLDTVVPFIREGLDKGEPVVVAVPTAKLALLRAALGADANRVSLADMAEVGRNPARTFPVLGTIDDTAGWARAVAEPMWPGRTAEAYPACVQNEALFNEAFAGRKLITLCPYDAVGLDSSVLADARATHPKVWEGDSVSDSADFAPWEALNRYNEPLPAEPEALTYTLHSVADLSAARRLAGQFAHNAGLSADRIGDLQLILTELATNSVEYTGGECTLALWQRDGSVVCQVSDSGHLDDPLAGRRTPELHRTGGRGLFLVNALSDLVRTHTSADGTTIRAYLALDRAAEPIAGCPEDGVVGSVAGSSRATFE